jgi:hypothetical protein
VSAARGSTPASTTTACCHYPTTASAPKPTNAIGRKPSTATGAHTPTNPSTMTFICRKFSAAAALSSLALAARDKEYGAVLAAKLRQRTSAGDSDAVVVREFLASARPLVDIAGSDPETSAAAIELARAWSGADLATRVSAQRTQTYTSM